MNSDNDYIEKDELIDLLIDNLEAAKRLKKLLFGISCICVSIQVGSIVDVDEVLKRIHKALKESQE